jgi:hypothetical protein
MVAVSKRAEKEPNKEIESDPVDMRSRLRPTIVDMKKNRVKSSLKPLKGVTRNQAQVKEPLKVSSLLRGIYALGTSSCNAVLSPGARTCTTLK